MSIKIPNKNVFIGWAILTIIAIATSFLGIYISKSFENKQTAEKLERERLQLQQDVLNKTNNLEKKSEEIEKSIKPKQSEFPDYYNIKGDNLNANINQLLITKNCPSSGCVNNKPATVDFDGIKNDYKVTGSFSRAYLYVEAMVDYNRPLSIWDDIYFNIFNQGGHLIPDGNLLPVPASDSSIYLYDMRSISYYPEIDNKKFGENKKEDQNLFDILRDGRIVRIHTSLSSDRPGRVLKEVSIYYECIAGSECSIEPIVK